MSEEKKNLRKELNEFDLEFVAGGNKEITASTPTDICPLCQSEIVRKNANSLLNHMGSEICVMIQQQKGLI